MLATLSRATASVRRAVIRWAAARRTSSRPAGRAARLAALRIGHIFFEISTLIDNLRPVSGFQA